MASGVEIYARTRFGFFTALAISWISEVESWLVCATTAPEEMSEAGKVERRRQKPAQRAR
jgi:hypothetical protein